MNPLILDVTPFERDILAELAADGASSADIAERLGIKTRTVDQRIHELLVRADLHSRTQLAVALLRRRILLRPATRRRTA